MASIIPWGGQDFVQFYVSSRLMIEGKNPFDWALAEEYQLALGRDHAIVPYGPPTVLLPILPSGLFSLTDAVRIYIVVHALLVLISCFLWTRTFLKEKRLALLVTCCLLPMLWPGTLALLQYGQTTGWVLLGVSVWLWQSQKGHSLWAGAALGFAAAMKPHLVAVLVVYSFVRSLAMRDWRFVMGLALSPLLLSVLISVVRPTIYLDWLHMLQTIHSPTSYISATISSWATFYLSLDRRFGFVLWATGMAIAAILAWRQRKREFGPELAVCLVTAGLCVVPHAMGYDYVILVPGMVWATILFVREETYLAMLWAVTAMYFALLTMTATYQAQFFPIPWVLLGASWWAFRKHQSHDTPGATNQQTHPS
jgi:hypothetical protein